MAAAIRLLAAVAAALALGACGGGSEDEVAADREARRGEVVETIGSGDITEESNGNGENGGENGGDEGGPCDEAPCKGPVYRRGGRVVLCGRLEVVRLPVTDVQVAPEQAPAVESVPGSEEQEEEEEEEEATVAEVRRPQCSPGTREITVVGLDFDALAGVETSEDGEAAWTTTEIELRGRIVDGTLVVDG